MQDDQFLLEVKIVQNRRSWLLMSGIQPISYSRLFIFDRKSTVREVKKKIYALFRPIIKCPIDLTQKATKGAVMSEEQVIEEEYKYFFENPKVFPASNDSDHPLY